MHTVDALLEEKGWSIEDLATQAGLDPARTAAIVDGRWLPSPDERKKIASALGTSLADVSWGHTMSPRNVRYHRFGLKEDFQ